MTHPRHFAETTPDKPAIIMANSGLTLTYAELEKKANQAAQLFRNRGLKAGDHIAFVLENRMEAFPFVWGAQRSGLIVVAISSHLTAGEIAYIVKDSGSKLILTSDVTGDQNLAELAELCADVQRYKVGPKTTGWDDWKESITELPASPIEDESAGGFMLYSSGTTGKPKGVAHPFVPGQKIDAPDMTAEFFRKLYGGSDAMTYLCPAPIYHAAPLRWSLAVNILGGTLVIMEKFDAETALSAIEKHRITHAQFVPTHFIRMLKLPDDVRQKFDCSSIEVAIHAAAPCPVPVKEQMIEWWGEVIWEYYSGSEGAGMTMISPQEWLTHKGSVGKAALGTLHICDENGDPLPPGEEGQVFFEGGVDFKYHKDEKKTQDSRNKFGWSSLGDVGRVDEEGYLYLTDRKSFMIISGGVNIYPQEIENHLVTHPKVADVAVIGGPDPEFGEKVIAVIQPMDNSDAGDAFAAELNEFCRTALSGVKVPRQIEFREQLPRTESGKLMKRFIRDEYWEKSGA